MSINSYIQSVKVLARIRMKIWLKVVFGLSKQPGRVPFAIIVKQSTGFDVFLVNLQDSSDKTLIDNLKSIFKEFLKTSTTAL
jgi:hypothetical protein